MKAVIFVGAAGSGKSTAARKYAEDNVPSVIIERDLIRQAQGFGPVGTNEQERLVTKIQDAQIEAALRFGMTPVIANTNTNKSIRNRLIKQIHKYGADVEVIVIHPPLDVVLAQNAQRGDDAVPEDIVRKMWNSLESQRETIESEYPLPEVAPYSHAGKPPVVCVDIDGTVADCTGVRSPYDYSRVIHDRPHTNVIDVVRSLSMSFQIIFVSGRKDSCRPDTVAWLDNYVDVPYTLFMRKADDPRPDFVIKNEIYDNEIIPNYDVLAVLDDRNQVITHLRKRGMTVLQVADGNF